MEVFLFVSSNDEMKLLEHTMLAWEKIDYAFPVNVVQLPQHRFEIKRRVTADEMAQDSHYVLCDLGCVLEEQRGLLGIMGHIKPQDGMVGFLCPEPYLRPYPSGIRIIRKGLVKKWPEQITNHYDQEHAAAIKAAGYKVSFCPTTFKRLLEC